MSRRDLILICLAAGVGLLIGLFVIPRVGVDQISEVAVQKVIVPGATVDQYSVRLNLVRAGATSNTGPSFLVDAGSTASFALSQHGKMGGMGIEIKAPSDLEKDSLVIRMQ